MKIQVKTTIEPVYGRIPARWRKRLPVIEGYPTDLITEYEVFEPKDSQTALSCRLGVAHPYGAEFHGERFSSTDWREASPVRVLFHPQGSGTSEARVYVKGLDDSDIILDDAGIAQSHRGVLDSDPDVRYYCRPFRVYSLHEVLTLFLAGLSALLAGSVLFFTVVLCILTFVLAVLTYRLIMVQPL